MRIAVLISRNYGYNYVLDCLARRHPEWNIKVYEADFIIKGKTDFQAMAFMAKKSSILYLASRFAETKIIQFFSNEIFRNWFPEAGCFDLDEVCRKYRIEPVRSKDFCSETSVEDISAFRPDVILSMTAQKLRRSLIDRFPSKIVNLHPGFLPDYQGIAPYVWAMSEGAARTGISIHRISDESIDTGELLARETIPLTKGQSFAIVFMESMVAGARLLSEILPAVAAGSTNAIDHPEGKYYKWPQLETVRRARRNGFRLLKLRDLIRIARRGTAL